MSSQVDLIHITKGSFGEILRYPGDEGFVYKMVLSGEKESAEKLEDEFEYYWDVYSALGAFTPFVPSDLGHRFTVPKPIDLYLPGDHAQPQPMLKTAGSSKPITSFSSTPWKDFPRSAFKMSMIPSLHPTIGKTYKNLFWSSALLNSEEGQEDIRLIRLYLGRATPLPSKTEKLQENLRSDPPLDLSRYLVFKDALKVVDVELPTLQELAGAMGLVLALLHWEAGLNARDVELVLGGSDDGQGVGCYVLDFNQCQRWLIPDALSKLAQSTSASSSISITTGTYAADDLKRCAERLSELIFYQESYYPRPHQPNYDQFKRSYLEAVQSICSSHSSRAASDNTRNEERGQEEGRGEGLSWVEEVDGAARAFFQRFESLNERKFLRLNSTANK